VSVTYTIFIFYNAEINVLLRNLKYAVASENFGRAFNSFSGLKEFFSDPAVFTITGSSFAPYYYNFEPVSNFDRSINIVGAIVGGCIAGVFVILLMLYVIRNRKDIVVTNVSTLSSTDLSPEQYEVYIYVYIHIYVYIYIYIYIYIYLYVCMYVCICI
jgi:hypothetical protein